jgi:hypothetical protein
MVTVAAEETRATSTMSRPRKHGRVSLPMMHMLLPWCESVTANNTRSLQHRSLAIVSATLPWQAIATKAWFNPLPGRRAHGRLLPGYLRTEGRP